MFAKLGWAAMGKVAGRAGALRRRGSGIMPANHSVAWVATSSPPGSDSRTGRYLSAFCQPATVSFGTAQPVEVVVGASLLGGRLAALPRALSLSPLCDLPEPRSPCPSDLNRIAHCGTGEDGGSPFLIDCLKEFHIFLSTD